MVEEFKRLVEKGYTIRRIREELELLGFVVPQEDKELILWVKELTS